MWSKECVYEETGIAAAVFGDTAFRTISFMETFVIICY